MLSVEARDPRTLSERDLEAWDALTRAASVPNPFFAPGFVLPTVEHRGFERARLLVAAEDGAWIGVLPVVRARSWRRIVASTAAWPDPYTLLGAPLVAAGREEEALVALLHLARRRVGLVALERVPADGPWARAFDAALARLGTRAVEWDRFERAALSRDDDAGASAKERSELRRRRRRLCDELEAQVEVVDRGPDPAAVDAFLALESSGWKGRSGTALSAAGDSAFFRDMCAGFARRGGLQLLSMQAGDRVVAMQCNLVSGGELFGFKTAFDESYAKFAPGIQLIVDAASSFSEREELARADSCAEPDNDAANRLWPGRRALRTVLVPGRGPLGALARVEAAALAALRARRRGA